jgi:hypothetical protein
MRRSFILCTIFIGIIFQASLLFAQSGNETITITTYYPSPYGVYGNLQALKSFTVGNFTSSEVQDLNPGQLQVKDSIVVGDVAAADAKDVTSGQLYVKESLRLEPRTTSPIGTPGKEGELAYYNDNLYVHNGSTWKIAMGSSTPPATNPPPTGTPGGGGYPSGFTLGSIVVKFHENSGNGLVSVQSCTNVWPGICASVYSREPDDYAGCESGWRVIKTGTQNTGSGSAGPTSYQAYTSYYNCIKE